MSDRDQLPPRPAVAPPPPPPSGGRLPGGPTLAPRLDSDLLAAMERLTTELAACTAELRAFREAWDRSPGPARGLTTNIRNSPDHKHRTGYRMGFAPASVETEQEQM